MNETWASNDFNEVLNKVFRRLKVVLCNILKGEGGNELVEEFCGPKHYDVKIENVIRELETNKDGVIDLHNYSMNVLNIDNEEEIEFEEI